MELQNHIRTCISKPISKELLLLEAEQIQGFLTETQKMSNKKCKKTKAMFFDIEVEPITTIAGNRVEQASTDSKEQDFRYLGSWT